MIDIAYRNIIKALDYVNEKNSDSYKKMLGIEDISENGEGYIIMRNLNTCKNYIRDLKEDVRSLYESLNDRINDLENENKNLKDNGNNNE